MKQIIRDAMKLEFNLLIIHFFLPRRVELKILTSIVLHNRKIIARYLIVVFNIIVISFLLELIISTLLDTTLHFYLKSFTDCVYRMYITMFSVKLNMIVRDTPFL